MACAPTFPRPLSSTPFINFPQLLTVSPPPLPPKTMRIFQTNIPNTPLFEEQHSSSIPNLPPSTRIAQQLFPQINIPKDCPPWSVSNDTIPSASTSTQMQSAGSSQSPGLFQPKALALQQHLDKISPVQIKYHPYPE